MAMGAIDSGFARIKTVDRQECARLISEAEDQLENAGGAMQVDEIARAAGKRV